MLLWSLIDKRKETGMELDYLQIFELSIVRKNEHGLQNVIHRQEYPPAIDKYYLPMLEPPNE